MIKSAVEALYLPAAAISDHDRKVVDELEAKLNRHVDLNMKRNGVAFETTETNLVAINEVASRIRRAGWSLELKAMYQPSRVGGPQRLEKFLFALAPTDAAYAEADKVKLS